MLTRGREQTDVCFHESLGGRQTLVFKRAHLDAKTDRHVCSRELERQTDVFTKARRDGQTCVFTRAWRDRRMCSQELGRQTFVYMSGRETGRRLCSREFRRRTDLKVHRNYRTEEQTDAYVHESEGDGPSCVHEN